MSQTVLRSDVAAILREWAAGLLSGEQVYNWANMRFAVDAWDSEDGAVNEVLAQLDTMDMNLVISEDIPMLLRALETTTSEAAAHVIESYTAAIDFAARRDQLKGEPLYSRFCQ